jgi:hypothetical protein
MKEIIDCGSGFPAANRFNAGSVNRGWKAAPTIKPTPKILKFAPVRLSGASQRKAKEKSPLRSLRLCGE